MSQQILLFRRLDVADVNAMPAWWFIAPPSPTAYVGFGQALALKCLSEEDRGAFQGVGIIHHDFRLRAEKIPRAPHEWSPHQFRGASLVDEKDYATPGIKGLALSLQPSVRCDVTTSIAVVFDGDVEIDDDRVAGFTHSARLSGGQILNPHDPIRVGNMEEARQAIGNGFSVHLREDLMQPKPGEDNLDALLRATHPDAQTRAEMPWVMPSLLGYATITDIAQRAFARDGLPHAFAEPLVGLVQMKSLRQAEIPVWKYQRPHERVFSVGY